MKKYIFAWIAILGITATTCKDDKKEKPTVQTDGVSAITEYTASVAGTVASDGGEALIARGVCYNVRPQPTIEQTKIEEKEGIGTGSFSANLTGLTHNTIYYVRAYARNAMGTTYGDEIEFTTLRIFAAPEVTTAAATNVELTTATIGGNVTDDGGKTLSAVGVVYSKAENPTLETGSKAFAAQPYQMGAFTCNLTDLEEATTYYYKAFATNDQGTTYGEQRSFTCKATQASPPTVLTLEVTTKAIVAATLSGQIQSTGGAEIIRRGVCWTDSPTELPDANLDTKMEDEENVSGVFSFAVAPTYTANGTTMVPSYTLQANTTYRFRAYAENSAGISYGDAVEFTTEQGGEMILVTAGTFQMGAIASEIPDEGHLATLLEQGVSGKHTVTISKNYYIGKYQVTNREFAAFLNDIGATGTNAVAPSGTYSGKTLWFNYASGVPNSGGVYQPAADRVYTACGGVSLNGAMAYCEWLSQKTGKKYRLPTEAEWEFAARGGNSSQGYIYSGSNIRTEVTVGDGNNNQVNIRVPGTIKPNELGIYDMSGNLHEFVSDYSSATYYAECAALGTVVDPKGPAAPVDIHTASSSPYHVVRGGYYYADQAWNYYVFGRLSNTGQQWNTEVGSAAVRLGFRIVMEVD